MAKTVFLAALIALMAPGPAAMAQEDCAFETWLANVYVVTASLSRGLDSGTQPVDADAALQLLKRYSPAELRLKLRQRGLSAREGDVTQYVLRNKSLLTTLRARGPDAARHLSRRLLGPEISQPMKSAVGGMQCLGDPNWSPGPILSGVGVSLLAKQTRDWAIVLGVLLAALCVVGLVSLWQRRERRRTRRHACYLPARLATTTGTCDTHLIDISLVGAKIDHAEGLEAGIPCRLLVQNQSLAAQMQWRKGEYCGLRFHRPLDPELLNVIVAASQADNETGGALAAAAH